MALCFGGDWDESLEDDDICLGISSDMRESLEDDCFSNSGVERISNKEESMEKVSEELKPCPFCGRVESLNVREVHTYGRYCADMYCIECRRCLYSTMNFDTKDELYEFWNTRPLEDEKDKEIAKLKEDLEIQKNLARQACFESNRAYDEMEKLKKMFYDLVEKQAIINTDPKVIIVGKDTDVTADGTDIDVGSKKVKMEKEE